MRFSLYFHPGKNKAVGAKDKSGKLQYMQLNFYL